LGKVFPGIGASGEKVPFPCLFLDLKKLVFLRSRKDSRVQDGTIEKVFFFPIPGEASNFKALEKNKLFVYFEYLFFNFLK
jgi:hypothetical protein